MLSESDASSTSISRRKLLAGAAALALAPRLLWASGWTSTHYNRAVVIDGLAGWTDADRPLPLGRLPQELAQAIRESGATAFHLTVGGLGAERFDSAVEEIVRCDRIIHANADLLIKANTAGDIRRAKSIGKVALMYGFQDSGMIADQLDRIGLFASLGVRFMQPTYNVRTLWADGALEPADAGLSRLGREAIERIESERVLLDLSHGGRRTIAEALVQAKRPPVITHTGCRALQDHPRNTDDSSLKLLADKGGVAGIYWTPFLQASGDASPDAVVRHMTHAVSVCGEDHVSVGTDGLLIRKVLTPEGLAEDQRVHDIRVRTGVAAPGEQVGLLVTVPEWNTPDRFRLLAAELDRAGWATGRIEKVLGANLLRLFADAWGGEA